MKKNCIIALLCILWAFTFEWGYFRGRRSTDIVVETRIDTVRITTPELLVICPKGSVQAKLPTVEDNTDSVEVEVPVEEAVYEGENYRAYVSGYRPSLDSLIFTHEINTITLPKNTKRPQISIGLQAGYGITPRGFQPYLGVGLSVGLRF